jgi:hypothetical protein
MKNANTLHAMVRSSIAIGARIHSAILAPFFGEGSHLVSTQTFFDTHIHAFKVVRRIVYYYRSIPNPYDIFASRPRPYPPPGLTLYMKPQPLEG